MFYLKLEGENIDKYYHKHNSKKIAYYILFLVS